MENILASGHFDLVTPDGIVTDIKTLESGEREAKVSIENISPFFKGFSIDKELIFFNIKSTLAQLGVDGESIDFILDPHFHTAQVIVRLRGIGKIGKDMLALIEPGAYIGKLFAADDRRRVRDPFYLTRMFGRSDRFGRPLLSLGGLEGSNDLILEKIEGRAVAFLSLRQGITAYDVTIEGCLDTIARALKFPEIPARSILKLHQKWNPNAARVPNKDDILLVKTQHPLHIRTVFAHVINSLLPKGYRHTSASVLEPNTHASGDIYELFGDASEEINDIPLEFYTLEPHREHVFFSDRDQLQACLEDPQTLFNAFRTAPQDPSLCCATFIVKGEQLLNLKEEDWICRDPKTYEFPGLYHPDRQALMVERYLYKQPVYPFMKRIQDGHITSQGILLVRHLPSPMMKKFFISDLIQRCLKGIYFLLPSRSQGEFFSQEDRFFLLDLAKFAIPVYWVDEKNGKILQYVPKPGKDAGMFVPLDQIDNFLKATAFGIYGSNLIAGDFEGELQSLLAGILELKKTMHHPLLNNQTPIALVTGGGPGAMEVGNRVAKNLGILSCANVMDFQGGKKDAVINEQRQNRYIDAKMTYRFDRLVERQSEFNLDFPILLQGGIGTDFEFSLEEVRRKIGAVAITPVLLFGTPEYWGDKITSRFQCNLKAGTIKGSEWISNCFYCVKDASQGLKVYKEFFEGTLSIGPKYPSNELGFVTVKD